MADLLFYEKSVALNKEIHKETKIVPVKDEFSFAAKTNSVIVAGIEFSKAEKEYPIVFSKTSAGKIVPVVMLGVRNNENLFVDKKNKWRVRYIPAFIRRYPFVFAEGENEGEKLTVCVDEAYPGFNSKKGEALFTKDGNNSQYLQNVIAFMQEYRGQFKLTDDFVRKVEKLGLFKEYTARIEMKSGEKFSMGGLLIVDEKKMLDMDEKSAIELFRSGQMAWIYYHLSSLENMSRLVDYLENA